MDATYLVYCPMNERASIFVFDASSPYKQINDLIKTSTAVPYCRMGFYDRFHDLSQLYVDGRWYEKNKEVNRRASDTLFFLLHGNVVYTHFKYDHETHTGEPCGMDWGTALSIAAMMNEDKAAKEDEVKREADAIGEITTEVRSEWFVDYGTCNGWDEETRNKFRIANILHDKDKLSHPEFHKERSIDTIRGWHETKCSCGFRHSCDSSD